MACLAEPTLGYGRRSVRALGQLVGLQPRHGRRGETTGNEVVKRHQLTGSCLLPPAGSSVAKPNLREEPRQERLFNRLLIYKKNFLLLFMALCICVCVCEGEASLNHYREPN